MGTDRMGVRHGLALLTATFGGEVDAWQVRAYERLLSEIADDVLLAGAERLIDEAAGGRKFYPLPTAPDWKAACAFVVGVRRRDAARLHLGGCPHTGYWVEDDQGRVLRCPCWKQAMVAMDAVAQPLALPPARGAEEGAV